MTFQTGELVRITYNGQSVDGEVVMASASGLSLTLTFDEYLGGYMRLMPVLWVLKFLPGVLLLLLSTGLLLAFVQVLVSNQHQLFFPFMCAGLVLAMLWYLYMQLPVSIQRLFHTIATRRTRGGRGHRHS